MLGAVAYALVDGARAGDSSSRVTPPPPPSSAGSYQKNPPQGSPARNSLSTGDGLLAGITAAVGDGVASIVERQGLITGAAAICFLFWFFAPPARIFLGLNEAFVGSVLCLVRMFAVLHHLVSFVCSCIGARWRSRVVSSVLRLYH